MSEQPTLHFLGVEFLSWLMLMLPEENWIIDLPSAFEDGTGPVGGRVEFAAGRLLVLEKRDITNARISVSAIPFPESSEALESIRSGAVVTRLQLHISTGEWIFTLTLDGVHAAIRQLKIAEANEEQFNSKDHSEDEWRDFLFERRFQALDTLENILDALFERFITRRIARSWSDEDLPRMREHVKRALQRTA
jgi:hypothetical protein